MIRTFLRERRSWIFLFVLLQSLTLFIALIDHAIPFSSIAYISFLSLLVFSLFLFYRYQKETRYYKSLTEWENSLDLSSLAAADSPFEKIIENSVISQTEKLKQEAAYHQLMLEQEKDELLSWIHEVKTPLTAMNLMIDRLDDPEMKAQLTYEWLRIHLLLDQQLHQKRIPFMENDLYMETVDIEQLLYQEIKTLQAWCIQKGIGFEVAIEAARVVSDAKWLAFIIRQLLTNAVKYSDASEIVLRSYQQGEHVILEVTDCGRGIDPKDVPRIFEKGFTSTRNHHDHAATGMGLYLAQKVAQALRIKIEVRSTLGAGTTFTLRFPKKNDFVKLTGM
ncbi:sensor histidine kinase [Brevibacillus sp. TJ4]|uniref:sensor histidine kinase n=1 Tax=Brevibacillus sp. TJ4 TaxID=3234853 RepID=UPI0037D8C9E9